jgi:hypothetical protein
MLNEQLYSFADLLNDADSAPNTPVVETYAGLHAKLQAQLAHWASLKKTEASSFCSHARAAGQNVSAVSTCH